MDGGERTMTTLSPKVTAATVEPLLVDAKAAAVAALPDLTTGPGREALPMLATGTDGGAQKGEHVAPARENCLATCLANSGGNERTSANLNKLDAGEHENTQVLDNAREGLYSQAPSTCGRAGP
jgi:hypothetical protein